MPYNKDVTKVFYTHKVFSIQMSPVIEIYIFIYINILRMQRVMRSELYGILEYSLTKTLIGNQMLVCLGTPFTSFSNAQFIQYR